MFFRDIEGVEPLYILPDPQFISRALNPYLAAAIMCDCMIGFFSSSALRELAPGLAEFLAKPFARMRLTVCPFLSAADRDALEAGGTQAAATLLRALELEYGKAVVDATALTKHTLRCLSYLVATERLTIKVVTVRGGLFHPKVWLLQDGEDRVAIHGSNNLTLSALVENIEQVYVTAGWRSPESEQVIDKLGRYFEELWSEPVSERVRVYAFPEALKARILKDYPTTSPPTAEDFASALREEATSSRTAGSPVEVAATRGIFEIPAHLNYESGTYAYQGEAVRAWEDAGGQGILEMATGSGKTITSLIAARRALERSPSGLLLVVAVPYLPLVNQWRREVELFGLVPTVPGDATDKTDKLRMTSQAVRSVTYGASSCECLVVTHDFLRDEQFRAELRRGRGTNMLIADEVHNLGTPSFLAAAPISFQFRLGLSATPVRQYDLQGTAGLIAYFGNVVYQFTLKDAIGRCLVPYDYYVHTVPMTTDEFEEWAELSRKLAENSWRSDEGHSGTSQLDPYIQVLLNQRRLLVEQAELKVQAFTSAITKEDLPHLKHTLVYASDKGRDQLRNVNRILMDTLGLKVHQVTQEETSTGYLADEILSNFATGSGLQVLTAMRVLDEGVDIPEVERAYFLASTTVERQWIQRRGRVLRKCERTNKRKAIIHDFLVVPPPTASPVANKSECVSLLRGELKRALEFCQLADNAGHPDGAMAVLTELSNRYL